MYDLPTDILIPGSLKTQDLASTDPLAHWAIWRTETQAQPQFLMGFLGLFKQQKDELFMPWIKRLAFLSDRLQVGLREGGRYLDLVQKRGSYWLDILSHGSPTTHAACMAAESRKLLKAWHPEDFLDTSTSAYKTCVLENKILQDETRSCLQIDQNLSINIGDQIMVPSPSEVRCEI